MPDKFNITKKSPLEEQIKKATLSGHRVNLLLFIIRHPKWWLSTDLVFIFFQPDLAFRLAGYTAGRKSHPASKTFYINTLPIHCQISGKFVI